MVPAGKKMQMEPPGWDFGFFRNLGFSCDNLGRLAGFRMFSYRFGLDWFDTVVFEACSRGNLDHVVGAT